MSAKTLVFVATCILAVLHTSMGYSGGAPPEVCEDMTPKHPAAPQTSKMPYDVKADSNNIRAGDKVKINIAGRSGFKGLLVQVRQGDKPVGQFNVSPSDRFLKTIGCNGGAQVTFPFSIFRRIVDCLFPGLMRPLMPDVLQNAVTHKNSELKNKITVEWSSPKDIKGQVTVFVTVAQDGGTYWVRQPKDTIKIN